MVVIKSVDAKSIFDSRKEKTIEVSIKTNVGDFKASAPNGKSKGKFEAKPWKKNLEEDIKTLKRFSDYFSQENLDFFDDLKRIEDIVDGHVGANTIFALESAILKAMAKEKKKEIWEIVDSKAKKFPRLVGNVIGGGQHSHSERKPDFQEFLLIPDEKSVKENFETMKKTKEKVERDLKEFDEKFKEKKNDEDAWETSLNEREVLDLLLKYEIPLGLDVAASSFYSRKKYHYKNPPLKRDVNEQRKYISNLIENFDLFYVEDPFGEEDFENFSELTKDFKDKLIVGDDLTVTNPSRFLKAIKMKSVSGIIVKPNQIGPLTEVKDVCEMAKKHGIKIVFSHRSGETEENILADLAFGFGADFFKCGITGKEREIKIKRLIEIEKNLHK
ncbi:MAG: enolase C-terminal domain-like protein [Nanoarchaeota archaeon]